MTKIGILIITMMVALAVLIVVVATDFWWLWLPISHSIVYPQKVAALFVAVSALVTLFVVYASFYATKQSNQREQKRGEDELSRERRDRDERYLGEIIKWAEDIRKNSSGSIAPNKIIYDDPTMARATQLDFHRLRMIYQDFNAKGTYIIAIARVCRGNLLTATENVICKLGEIIIVLENCLTSSTTKQEEKHEEVEACKMSLDSSARDLIEEATETKTREIG